jgi:hypothetical protein
VTGLSATSGPVAGGTALTATGTNLTGATTVSFGATSVAFTFVNDTTITTTSPAGSGTVDVTVTTPGGTSATSSADQFTYTGAPPPSPAVTSLSVTAGPAAGGTVLTITGTNLTGATAVAFGPWAAPTFTVNNATSITVTSPAGTATQDVTVTTPGGTSAPVPGDKFTYSGVPGTPTGLTATVNGTTVTLTWVNAPGSLGVNAHRNGTKFWVGGYPSPTPTTFVQSGVAPGTYTYTVNDYNSAGQGVATSGVVVTVV